MSPAERSRRARRGVARRVAVVQRWLTAIYRLELDLDAARLVMCPQKARALVPGRSPRSGVLALEEDGDLWLGVYLDPRDQKDADSVVEETSHLVCLAWHAAQRRPVSRLLLELQGEVDRYVVNRLRGRDGLRHFRRFRWEEGLDAASRSRYEAAHQAAHRYCRGLSRRYPERRHTGGLLRELRHFYRASGIQKLRAH
ncbi:MAG: hypothetical protein ACQGVC_04040 [Myxococcota bacterium]